MELNIDYEWCPGCGHKYHRSEGSCCVPCIECGELTHPDNGVEYADGTVVCYDCEEEI